MSPTPAGPRKVLRWLRRRLLPPASSVRTPEVLAREAVFKADQARDRRDWTVAAEAYALALSHHPGDAAIHVQHGHMLKEAGRLDEAEAAYRAAAAAAPYDADPWLQLAHVLKALGRASQANDAFVEALRRDPKVRGARDELVAVGARNRLPQSTFGPSAGVDEIASIGRSLDTSVAALREWVQISTYPVEAYDAFRRAYPLAPAPERLVSETITIVVDALGASPAALGRTLDSLLNQTHASWTALIRAGTELHDHPVAGHAVRDARIGFVGADVETVRERLSARKDAWLLAMPAGVVLDPEALNWFVVAARRAGATAIYADHDHHEDHWRLGPVHRHPALQSMPDPDDLISSPHPPLVVLLASDQRETFLERLSEPTEPTSLGRDLLLSVGASGGVGHLPRLLSSQWLAIPGSGEHQFLSAGERQPATDGRTLVIIPTRDQPELLAACVRSLRELADRPDDLDFVIIDNRSSEDGTLQLLAELAADGADIIQMDEPFNWARFNNHAARGKAQSLLVFANNDVEAISRGWDTTIRQTLARPDIGAVGARLLYPDRTLQHCGILLGGFEGRPVHEGVGAEPLADGPMGRYRRTRPVAAVTGAFMAVRRETFERLGGFDERLAVGYNDIDFCLRVRADGLKVLYAADLVLIHHESKTRGLNNSEDKVAWDDTELKRLYETWGKALFADPGVNPHWSSASGRPMDGYREPSLFQIFEWLDRSVKPLVWSLRKPD